jgi:hypothetical protein
LGSGVKPQELVQYDFSYVSAKVLTLGKNRYTVSSYRASHLCDFSSALAMTISLQIIFDMQYTCTVFPLCKLSDVSSNELDFANDLSHMEQL